MSLTIRGEAGKALDATSRSFETMRIRSASLRLATLEDDVFEWTASTAEVTAGTAPIPEVGQIVELFDGVTRRFRGHALDPVFTLYGVQIRVVGPWWWMRGENATSDQTDEVGNTEERPIVRFESGNLSTHISTAITDMITAGVPLQAGTIASTFDIPTVSYQVSSWADVISRLMEWIADGIAWFDYSGTGAPSLNVSRRGSMSTETITIGTTLLDPGSFRFAAVTDLKADGISIPYMDRDPTTGKPRFQEQTAGTMTTRKAKIVPVAGPELLDFLPFDDFDSWEYLAAASIVGADIWNLDRQFDEAKKLQATNPLTFTPVTVKNATSFATQTTTFTPSITITDENNVPVSLPRYIVTPYRPPEWAIQELGLIPVNISGNALITYVYDTHSTSGTIPVPAYIEAINTTGPNVGYTLESNDNVWTLLRIYSVAFSFEAFGGPVGLATTGSTESGTGTFLTSTTFQLAAKTYDDDQYIGRKITILLGSIPHARTISGISGNVVTITPALSATGTRNWSIARGAIAYKELDYGFLNPPTGLATNLLSAQSFVPWEGGVTLKSKTAPNPQVLSKKWNVANLGTAPASAGAMLRSVDLDLASYDMTLRWGAPARLNYQSLVRQASARPQDTIVEL